VIYWNERDSESTVLNKHSTEDEQNKNDKGWKPIMLNSISSR
jgi:hypothetical protein